jgi:hypothetical protein
MSCPQGMQSNDQSSSSINFIWTQSRPIWTKPGPTLDQTGPIWTKSGPNLDQIWTKSGPNLDQIWTKSGKDLDQIWTKSRSNLEQVSVRSLDAMPVTGADESYDRGCNYNGGHL